MVILDARKSLREYRRGHVPGAQHVSRRHYLAWVDGIPGMFPGVEKSVELLESLGISNGTPVVVYDDGPGLWAARLLWTLAYLGHKNWAVLDGGYRIWEKNGYEVVKGNFMSGTRGSFKPDIQSQILINGDELMDRLGNCLVLDVRSEPEYQGKFVSGLVSKRRGHIPGSLWIEWTMSKSDSELSTMLSPDELRELYGSRDVSPDDSIVTLCYAGVRAAHTWLALMIAGYKDVALYDGSWVEWSSKEKYPVEI